MNFQERIVHINVILRNNSTIRLLFSPLMNEKKKWELNRYKSSSDSRKIKEMQNSHKGERCFIVLNGPSLIAEDLNKIVDEFSFGCNRIYDIYEKTQWRPNIYITIDKSILQARTKSEWLKLKDSEIFCYWNRKKVPKEIKEKYNEIICWGEFKSEKCSDVSEVSRDVSSYFSIPNSVSISMLEFAIYMGFQKIYIIGCDHNFAVEIDKNGNKKINSNVIPHFNEQKDKTIYASNKEALTENYEKIRRYAESIGVEIYNATRGGKLEVFNRVNFDELFKGSCK